MTMSSHSPLEDDLTPNHHAHHAYTTSDYETLGLNPNVDLQTDVFPPFRPVETAPSLLLSPILESSSYPISGSSDAAPGNFDRSICDLYTSYYEPKSTVWTPDGQGPDINGGSRGTVIMMDVSVCP